MELANCAHSCFFPSFLFEWNFLYLDFSSKLDLLKHCNLGMQWASFVLLTAYMLRSTGETVINVECISCNFVLCLLLSCAAGPVVMVHFELTPFCIFLCVYTFISLLMHFIPFVFCFLFSFFLFLDLKDRETLMYGIAWAKDFKHTRIFTDQISAAWL